MFYGEKLSSLRELNGLSRKDLAEKLAITEQAIWQYETDSIMPRIEVINQLRTLFHVDAKYFFSKNYLINKTSEEKVAYRAKDRESRKKTKLELTFLNFVDYYITYLERSLVMPEPRINILRKKSAQLLKKENRIEKKELIKQVAELTRTELGLQNNKDLMYVLEKSGIYIIEKNLGSQVDTYSTITADNRPYIILGTVKKSAVRRNFDLVHELGHLLLHSTIDMDILTPAELKVIEKEADLFASIFLLPEAEFIEDFKALTRKSNPDHYVDLKKKYLVSIAALEMRAYGLGLMTYQENRYFWGQLNKKGYKLFEPLDDEIPPVRPGRIRSLCQFVLDNKVIEIADVLSTFHIAPKFLTSLFGLDENFFDHYLEVEKDYFSGTTIIDFEAFRNRESFI